MTCSSRCLGPRPTVWATRRRRPRPELRRSSARASSRVAGDAVFIKVENARRALSLLAARIYPQQPKVIAAVTGTSGKTSVAAFTRQIWAALGYEAASVGTIGVVTPKREVYGSLTTPDPVDLHRTLSEIGGRGHHASGDRGVVAWPRSAPARRRSRRRRWLHQSEPRPSRLSSERRGLSRREASAVRSAGGRRRRCGDRRRPRAQRRGCRGGEKARVEAYHGWPQRRRHSSDRHQRSTGSRRL